MFCKTKHSCCEKSIQNNCITKKFSNYYFFNMSPVTNNSRWFIPSQKWLVGQFSNHLTYLASHLNDSE